MTDGGPTEDRLATIEMLLSHLQHDIDKLNEAFMTQDAEIDELKRSLARLEAAVVQIPQPPDDPLDERPPHY